MVDGCASSQCHCQSYWWLEIGHDGCIYTMEISKYYKLLLLLPCPCPHHQEQLANLYQHNTANSPHQSTLNEHNLHPACSNHFSLCPMVTSVTSLIGLTC